VGNVDWFAVDGDCESRGAQFGRDGDGLDAGGGACSVHKQEER
jgi:hypothetical protein